MKILLGKNVIDKPFYWSTDKEKNSHMIVLGTSGSGKTETLKSIIHEINLNKVPSLIIDFHNEFGGLAKNVLNLREVSINPLEISGESRPENVVYEISDIIKKIFQLGEIQEAILRHAIRQSYLDYGIDLKKKGPFSDYPNFSDVEANIYRQEDSKNKTSIGSLISRIEPLFELDVFKSSTNISFKDILKETTVVELMDFPTETVKSTIAEFFLSKLSYYLYSLEKIKKLRLFCIIDEAHRLMYDNSPLNRLLRESRKYGIGVILASQRPSDFNETILANVGGILSFQCSLDKDAKFVGRQLNLEPRKIKNLVGPGLGYVKFSRNERPEKIKIIPLKERFGVGPSKYYEIKEINAIIGFISALTHNFCETCDKIRITSDGKLRVCLALDDEVSIKEAVLKRDEKALISAAKKALEKKPLSHNMSLENMISGKNMYQIGG